MAAPSFHVPIVKVAPARMQCLRSWMYVSLFAQRISGTMAGYSRFISSACEKPRIGDREMPSARQQRKRPRCEELRGILVLVILPLRPVDLSRAHFPTSPESPFFVNLSSPVFIEVSVNICAWNQQVFPLSSVFKMPRRGDCPQTSLP